MRTTFQMTSESITKTVNTTAIIMHELPSPLLPMVFTHTAIRKLEAKYTTCCFQQLSLSPEFE